MQPNPSPTCCLQGLVDTDFCSHRCERNGRKTSAQQQMQRLLILALMLLEVFSSALCIVKLTMLASNQTHSLVTDPTHRWPKRED
eukprot:1673217-Amphidinium_carterae.1